MKIVKVNFTDEEYEQLTHNKRESEFAGRGVPIYCKSLCLNPKGVEVKVIDSETQSILTELTNIMAVYAYFAEHSENPVIYNLFLEYEKRVKTRLNELI